MSWKFATTLVLTGAARAVSKSTLDWAVFDGKTTVLQTQSPNSEKGIKTVLRLLKELPDFSVQFSIICLEHTARAAPRYLQCGSS